MSGQDGPVRAGQPEREPFADVDRALAYLDGAVDSGDGLPVDPEAADALVALRILVTRARAYVKSPDGQRLALLASVLQEPVREHKPADVETVVQAWLTSRDLVTITRRAARQLGILNEP